MNTLGDPNEAISEQQQKSLEEKQAELGAKQLKLKDMEAEVDKKAKVLSTLELKLYKVEKDYAKAVRDFDETERSIKTKSGELEEFTKKEYELQLEVQLAKAKLEVVQEFLKKAKEAEERVRNDAKLKLENLIKENYESLQLLHRQEDNLKAIEKLAEVIVQLIADPSREIHTIEDLEACLRKPEEVISHFFESNYLQLRHIFSKNQASSETKDILVIPIPDESSPKAFEDPSQTKESSLSSLKQLVKGFFDSKSGLSRSDPKYGKLLNITNKSQIFQRDPSIPFLNVKAVVSPYNRTRNAGDNSFGALRDSMFERNKEKERRDPKLEPYQSGYSTLMKQHRQFSSNPNLDDDSIVIEKDHVLNESHLDQSYFVIIDNVFSLLDNLFQRLKSHVRLVYDECMNFVEEMDLPEEHSVSHKLRQ